MAKRAVLVGCNYPGTKAELHGCVNDVSRMYKCLVDRFGFAEDDITVMVDTDKRSVQPTGANMKKVLGRLIEQSESGDILVMHYSGHGTQVPAESGDDEDDGLDEAVVPTDLNLLTDDDFRLLFRNIKRGVIFTFISDSCHSGGLIDHEKEQIGAGDGSRSFQSPVPAQSRGYGGGTRDYGGGYGRESSEYEPRQERHGHREYGEYGRREEPKYESREERQGHREYGEYGRTEEPEYESREERHGHREHGEYGRREEPEYESREERYGHHFGRREEPAYGEYGSREERDSHHLGRREEPDYEPRREAYGHQEYGHRHEEDHERRVPFNNKSLSLETLTQMLSEQSGHEVKPGNIRTSLYDMFGEDASPTVKVFVNLLASKLSGGAGDAQGSGGGLMGTLGGLAMDFMKTKLNDSDSSFVKPAQMFSNAVSQSGHAGAKPPRSERVADDVGILVSGCQSNETSADANPSGNPAQAYGALSNGIQTILAQKQGPISNGELVTEVRALLKKQGFSQHPCLYSSDANVNAPFICE